MTKRVVALLDSLLNEQKILLSKWPNVSLLELIHDFTTLTGRSP